LYRALGKDGDDVSIRVPLRGFENKIIEIEPGKKLSHFKLSVFTSYLLHYLYAR